MLFFNFANTICLQVYLFYERSIQLLCAPNQIIFTGFSSPAFVPGKPVCFVSKIHLLSIALIY